MKIYLGWCNGGDDLNDPNRCEHVSTVWGTDEAAALATITKHNEHFKHHAKLYAVDVEEVNG